MITYIFDGSKIGLFNCIFKSYYEKQIPDTITDGSVQLCLGDTVYNIENDLEKSNRVSKCLKEVKTPHVLQDVNLALKSGEKNKFSIVFDYLKTVIDNKQIDVSKNYANKSVLNFTDLIRRITNEIHRFKGFIRFEETVDGYYYAHFNPDNDITWLLMPHFVSRFANQAYIIHDVKRNVLGLFDGNAKGQVCAEDRQVTVYLSEEEVNFKKLWQTYYKSVNIKERKNHKLMKNFMPIKYWNHLPEKHIDATSF